MYEENSSFAPDYFMVRVIMLDLRQETRVIV